MSNLDNCAVCGVEIPEGFQICQECEKNEVKKIWHGEMRYCSDIYRGDVFFADLNPVVGSEIGGIRPVVILQNNIGNKYSSTLIAAVTTRFKKNPLPTHVRLSEDDGGLTDGTTILLEQIRTLDKRRLRKFIGHLDDETMIRVDRAAARSLDIKKNHLDDEEIQNEV